MHRSILPKIISFVTSLVLLVTPLQARMPVPHDQNEEYTLKATFLYRFTDYIEWTNNRPAFFSIAILGQSPITAPLLEIAKVKTIKNKKISVTEYNTLEAIDHCQILFVPADCPVPIETIVAHFGTKQVFIVTEKEGSCKKGAHLNFIIEENRLKFEINTKAINRSNFTVSAFLLQHAVIVE